MSKDGTVRFPMVFSCWCIGCDAIVEFGTRFNAVKRKIDGGCHKDADQRYEFSMKCRNCEQQFVIESDPLSTGGYKAVSGLRVLHSTIHKLENQKEKFLKKHNSIHGTSSKSINIDPVEDLKQRKQRDDEAAIVDMIKNRNDHRFKDDYLRNCKLRLINRERRKLKEKSEREGKSIGLGFPLLPEYCLSENESAECEKLATPRIRVKKRRRVDRLTNDPLINMSTDPNMIKPSSIRLGSVVVKTTKKKKKNIAKS